MLLHFIAFAAIATALPLIKHAANNDFSLMPMNKIPNHLQYVVPTMPETRDTKDAATNTQKEGRDGTLIFPTPNSLASTDVNHHISTDIHENPIIVIVNSTNIKFNVVNGTEHLKAVQERDGGEVVDEKDEQADFEEG